MASSVSTDQKASRESIVGHLATGGTSVEVAWVDMRDYGRFSVLATVAALTGTGMTKLEILANDESDGGGTDVVVKDSGAIAADALEDQAFLECTAGEIAQLASDNGVDLRYLTARVTLNNAADVVACAYIRDEARHQYDGLTPATTIAS